jgi:hypothetical protein
MNLISLIFPCVQLWPGMTEAKEVFLQVALYCAETHYVSSSPTINIFIFFIHFKLTNTQTVQ